MILLTRALSMFSFSSSSQTPPSLNCCLGLIATFSWLPSASSPSTAYLFNPPSSSSSSFTSSSSFLFLLFFLHPLHTGVWTPGKPIADGTCWSGLGSVWLSGTRLHSLDNNNTISKANIISCQRNKL